MEGRRVCRFVFEGREAELLAHDPGLYAYLSVHRKISRSTGRTHVTNATGLENALHLPLEDARYDFSVLSEFRDQLVEGQAEKRVFEKLVGEIRALGLIKERDKQRSDSIAMLVKMRRLSRAVCLPWFQGMRISRYIDQKKRNVKAIFTGCAANLKRTAHWLAGERPQVRHPKSRTLTSAQIFSPNVFIVILLYLGFINSILIKNQTVWISFFDETKWMLRIIPRPKLDLAYDKPHLSTRLAKLKAKRKVKMGFEKI